MHTLVLLGELDRTSCTMLEAAIEGACEGKAMEIVLDLRRLSRLDCTGAAVIAFRRGWCERHGLELALIAGPAHVQQVFADAGLLEGLTFVEPEPEPTPREREQEVLLVGA